MLRRVLPFALCAVLAACPTYDRYGHLADQDGMEDADAYAKAYGAEAAQKVAIGRKLAEAYRGKSAEEFGAQMQVAADYAKTLPDVETVRADTLAHILTIRFKSGWQWAATPVDDGKRAEDTPGLPAAKAAAK